MSQHLQPRPASKWRRRIFGLPVFAWAILSSLTAAAVVGFIVLLGTSGTITSGDGIDVTYTNDPGPSAVAVSGSPTCTATWIDADTVQFDAADVLPGDACEYSVETSNDGVAAARLQSFKLESGDFGGNEVTATLGASCGSEIVNEGAANGTSILHERVVNVTLTFGEISPSASYTLDPSVDGFEWVVADAYQAGQCS